ncbi:MAG TPA: hypothetical protein VK325_04170 [Pseudoxanthomonas sp.]|nr:hypothetical protein [Pseudoxanthomonas sp.]
MPYRPARSSFRALGLAAALSLVLAVLQAQAQAQSLGNDSPFYPPRSGDAWLDRHLADINRYAARYPHSFADELARYYAVPRAYVEALLQQPGWQAGDVFMACALAQRAGQPCRALVRERSRDREAGWDEIARRIQLEPESPPFQELRSDVEASYRRWARPLLTP